MTTNPNLETPRLEAPENSTLAAEADFWAEQTDDDVIEGDDAFIISSIGFVGTRHSLLAGHKSMVEFLLLKHRPFEVHHSDGLGADAEFHHMVREILPNTRIIVYPSRDPKHRAFCAGDERRPERASRSRNQAIVRASHLLLVVADEVNEQWHSGAWSTIRFARSRNVMTLGLTP